jgi:medium-chain acyl-[acyl-carrier-protein] hydrolase
LRLLCFPYAGGAANIFRAWADSLPATVEVCAVQLPGRGGRLLEPPFTDLLLLVRTAAQELLPFLDRPFAFFGHSMGATISYELAQLLRKDYNIEPLHLFASGRCAPQLPDEQPVTYDLPEPKFLEELRQLNGTPAEVLEHPELIELLLPVLRADFELIQTHVYSPKPPLDCPITAFGGVEDKEVRREQLDAWREQTRARFSLQMFPGDHFFLHTAQPLLLESVARELGQLVSKLYHK